MEVWVKRVRNGLAGGFVDDMLCGVLILSSVTSVMNSTKQMG